MAGFDEWRCALGLEPGWQGTLFRQPGRKNDGGGGQRRLEIRSRRAQASFRRAPSRRRFLVRRRQGRALSDPRSGGADRERTNDCGGQLAGGAEGKINQTAIHEPLPLLTPRVAILPLLFGGSS